MLKPIESNTLFECMENVKDVLATECWNILQENPESEMIYRTAIYMSSAMLGWKFMRDVLAAEQNELVYDIEEEEMNFHTSILKTDQIDLDHYFRIFSDHYHESEEVGSWVEKEPDFVELDGVMNTVQQGNAIESGPGIRECLGRYLYKNGCIDEQRCKNNPKDSKERRRLVGYPIIKLQSRFEKYGNDWIRATLYAIDYGKGSIVSKILEEGGKKYFLSVIHAGEQNYKYFEETYFPFLYGLYAIECEADRRELWKNKDTWKENFITEYQAYWITQGRFLLQDDMEILKNMNVTSQFSEVILKTAWDYFNKPEFNEAIRMSQEILNG